MRDKLLRNAKNEAQVSMQRAESLWKAFERAGHRIRYSVALEAHYRHLYHTEVTSSHPRPKLLARIYRLIECSHDMRLCEEGNMCNFAEQARSAEMMARIWHEEGEDTDQEEFRSYPQINDW